MLAGALEGDLLLIGSGSSLFAAQLGAAALRRRGIDANAVAATEAPGDHLAYEGRTVVAISQSGRSTDVLRALEALRPRRILALTNTADSPLGALADVTIDVGAGPERAIPATKSVSSTIAILLAAATLLGGAATRSAAVLVATARTIRLWLEDSAATLLEPARLIAARTNVVILGTDYGAPIAREAALKFKEATYLHAEGFEAGEFRHGSAAMVDGSTAAIGIVDRDGSPIVGRAMHDLQATGALRLAIGTAAAQGIARLGPIVEDPYNTLAWLVTVQMLALYVARRRGIDSDAPRGLTKAVVSE
ncbi:MAG: SIS domain-containing protein [Candidatus Eremiobacteraeota bacterium]|nr:SIS domain-containing protein [Candidatus Eremiobacteraeota bacterium]